ncbi:MAG: glycosyltransferase family A protein [Planctomycetota bacterium]
MSSNSPPAVSVLLPVRDADRTLAACLRSVARQTWADFEVVLVDDGSQDGGPAIARAWAERDARIRCLATPRRGLVHALTHGLDACRGEVVVRMDADDIMHRERLAAQIAALRADIGLAGVGSHVRIFPRRHLRSGRLEYEAWLNGLRGADDVHREMFVECPLAHPTWAVRRAVLAGCGYRDVPWAEDYDVLLRLALAGHRFGVVPRRLLSWRDHPRRSSRCEPRYGLDRFVAAKAHFLCLGWLANHGRYTLWGYGATGRSLARALLGLGRSPRAIVDLHPGRIGNRILGAPVVAPHDLPRLRGTPLLVSVAGSTPRSEIRAALHALGFAEGRDFVCVA